MEKNGRVPIMKSVLRIKPSNDPSIIKAGLKFLLSEGGLLLLVGIYALVGAQLYINMEAESEALRYEAKQEFGSKIEDAISYMSKAFHNYARKRNMSRVDFEAKVEEEIQELLGMILDGIENHNYDGEIEGWEWDWTYSKSLLFSISIMTTIGYGHIAPKTFTGQMVTIPYSLLGMGVFMVFLAKVGNALANILKYIYGRIICWYFTSRKRQTEKIYRNVEEDNFEDEDLPLPLSLSFFILISYLALGSWFFSIWEPWDMISSFYFTFITLTTIGFGDLSPSFDTNSLGGKLKILLVMIYVVCGMALISMVISLLQEGAKKRAENMVQSLNTSAEDANKDERLQSSDQK